MKPKHGHNRRLASLEAYRKEEMEAFWSTYFVLLEEVLMKARRKAVLMEVRCTRRKPRRP
jgi:hypothetical protein